MCACMLGRGVSRISARWVLKVRPHTKSGGAIHFRSDTKSGGVQSLTTGGGGAVRLRRGGGGGGGVQSLTTGGGGGSPLTTGGGGGGGGGRPRPPLPPGSYASETVTILTKRVLKHLANDRFLFYSFFNFIHSLLLFIL